MWRLGLQCAVKRATVTGDTTHRGMEMTSLQKTVASIVDRYDSFRETSCDETYDVIMEQLRSALQTPTYDGAQMHDAIIASFRRGFAEAKAEGISPPDGFVLVPIQDPKELESWLFREFPQGCVMGDPAYWAKRITRKFIPQSSKTTIADGTVKETLTVGAASNNCDGRIKDEL